MRYWYMNETAYPNLPPESEYDSIRVTMPNRNMDPGTAARWWDDYLEEYQAAAEFGFDLMLNEHHGTATCMNVAGPVTSGVLARITTGDSRILLLGNPIANRSDPVRVAEEMALVDVLSHGRLEVGFVRGVPYEVSATNSNPVTMVPRFWEAMDLIIRAWTTHDGPFAWQGRFFEHRQVNIWPRPYQDPHPPVWVASLSPGSARIVGEHGFVCATFLTGTENTRKIFDGYRQGWRDKQGGDPGLDRFAYLGLVYTGETDDEGLAGAERLTWYIRSNKAPQQFMDPPGYRPVDARVAEVVEGSFRSGLRTSSVEELVERGAVFAGSPSTVADQIERFYDGVGGFGNMILMGRAGEMQKEDTIGGLRRFRDDVKPILEERGITSGRRAEEARG